MVFLSPGNRRQGVSRSEMTQEFKRAVWTGSGYLQLKNMTRNSLEYSFIEATVSGRTQYAQTVMACAKDKPTAKLISDPCTNFLAENSKARIQWKLEKDLADFETRAATWDTNHLP